MAQPVYSSVLIASSGFTGTATLDIPAGIVCIVRDIDVVAGISVGGLVFAYDTAGVKFAANNFGTVTGDYSLWTWRGRQVIPGPGSFSMTTDFAADIRASGYLLSQG